MFYIKVYKVGNEPTALWVIELSEPQDLAVCSVKLESGHSYNNR